MNIFENLGPKIPGVGTVPLMKMPTNSVFQSPLTNFFDTLPQPTTWSSVQSNAAKAPTKTPAKTNVNMLSADRLTNPMSYAGAFGLPGQNMGKASYEYNPQTAGSDTVGNYVDIAGMDWKGDTTEGKAVKEDITKKKTEIVAELRSAYGIKPNISDDEIFTEFVKQNKDSGVLDQYFGSTKQAAKNVASKGDYRAIYDQYVPNNMLTRAFGENVVGGIDLASKGIGGIYEKTTGQKSSTNVVEDLVSLAGAASRMGATVFMPGVTTAFSLASEMPGSRDLIEATLGKAQNYITESKGFGLLDSVYDQLGDDNLKNEMSGIIMNGLFTTLGMRVRNTKGQLSARTVAENFTNPKNLMANIEEIVFNKAKQGEIQGTLLQEIMNAPQGIFNATKRLFPDKMPKMEILDANKNPISGKAPSKAEGEVTFTDRMLAKVYGMDADNIRNIREETNLFRNAEQGALSNDTVSMRFTNLLDNLENQKGEIGLVYEELYKIDALLPGREIKQEALGILKDMGIKVEKNGEITWDTKKIVLNQKEVPVIKNILKTLDDLDTDVITPKEAHTVRKNIYANRQYEDGMAKVSSPTAEKMINILDSKLKELPSRAKTDKMFSEKATQLRQIQKELFKRDGTLRVEPTTLLTEKNRKKLAFLEEQMPGITKELKAIKSFKDYENTRNKHKVGLYEKAGSTLGNLGAVGAGGLIGGIPGLVGSLALVLAKEYATDPKRMIDFIKKRGGQDLFTKVSQNEDLSVKERAQLNDIMSEIESYNKQREASRPRLPEPKPAEITPEGVIRQKAPITAVEKRTFKKKDIVEVDRRSEARKDPYAAEKAMEEQKKTFKKQEEVKKQEAVKEKLAELQGEERGKRQSAGYGKDINKPQPGDMTKLGKVVEVKEMGGKTNDFRVKVEGDQSRHNPYQIDGVYHKLEDGQKPVIKDFDELLKEIQQENPKDPLSDIVKGGKREYYLKQFADETGISIEQITDPADRQKLKDMVTARDPNKQRDLMEELTKKYGDSEIMFKREKDAGQVLSNGEAIDYIKKYFEPSEVNAKFVKSITTPDGMKAIGSYSNSLISFVENPTKKLLDHEALHAYIDKFTDPGRRDALYKEAYGNHGDEVRAIQKKFGIGIKEATEEWIADNFVAHVQKTRSFTGKIGLFFDNLWNSFKNMFGKGSKIQDLYNDILNKVRPEEKMKIQGEVRWKAFGENDKYTLQPILDIRKEVKGDFIKKATLEQMKNRQNYKGPEKEALQSIIDNMEGDTIIKDFAIDQLKQSIMPLQEHTTSEYAEYNKLYSPKNAYTMIYEAPFNTSVDNHFGNPKYFSHVRIEGERGNKILMELQSDLMQNKKNYRDIEEYRIKDILRYLPYERDIINSLKPGQNESKYIAVLKTDVAEAVINTPELFSQKINEAIKLWKELDYPEYQIREYEEMLERYKNIKNINAQRKVNSYKNEARMRRTLDETVKSLADDGNTTLKIPYGITIAQIEGHYNAISIDRADVRRVIDIVKNDERFLSVIEQDTQEMFDARGMNEERDDMSPIEREDAISANIPTFFEGYGVDIENNTIIDPAMFSELIDLVDDSIPPEFRSRLDNVNNNQIELGKDYSSEISKLRSEHQTVANFYEKQLIPYAKKMYQGGKDVEYNGGIWYEINIENIANKPLKVFKRAETPETVTKKDIKVYRGEGKGIGNTTFVKGQYFADSEKFASEFGDVVEDVIPAGSKVFDFDKIKDDPNQKVIPQEILVDPDKTTKWIADQGYDATKNTNSRGVEYVKINKGYNDILDIAIKSETFEDFTKTLLSDWDTYKTELNRIERGMTMGQKMRSSGREILRNIARKFK